MIVIERYKKRYKAAGGFSLEARVDGGTAARVG